MKMLLSEAHMQLIEALKSQLLIAFLRRLGGKLEISATEVDETGKFNLAFSIKDSVFYFELQEK